MPNLRKFAGSVAKGLKKLTSTPNLDTARARLSPKPSPIRVDTGAAVASARTKSVSAFRAPEAKVKRAEPSKTVAPKTVTSPDPYASAAKAFKSPVHKSIGDAVRARNAAKASGDKAAYASAQNAINEAYGSKVRHASGLGLAYKARLETKRSLRLSPELARK